MVLPCLVHVLLTLVVLCAVRRFWRVVLPSAPAVFGAAALLGAGYGMTLSAGLLETGRICRSRSPRTAPSTLRTCGDTPSGSVSSRKLPADTNLIISGVNFSARDLVVQGQKERPGHLFPVKGIQRTRGIRMRRAVKRVLLFTSAAAVSLVVGGGLAASPASAAENTLVRNDYTGHCISDWGGGNVSAGKCNSNDRNKLWDRQGNRIVKAFTNQCLDSNGDGNVYLLECNGGRYQMWDFRSDKTVVNVATGRALYETGNGYLRTFSGPAPGKTGVWTFSN
jgi:hypothetical protein